MREPQQSTIELDVIKVVFGSLFFLLGWLLIVRDHWPCLPPIGRPIGAFFGASLFVITGILPPEKAFQAISLETLALLLGVMLITQMVQELGGFHYLTRLIGGTAETTPTVFLVRVALVGALSAALVTNDTTCLFMTPIVARSCIDRGFNPAPFILALATSTNIGSASTPIGSPQNIIIASVGKVSFLEFLKYIGLASVVGVIINTSLIWFAYRNQLYLDSPHHPPLLAGVEKQSQDATRRKKKETECESVTNEVRGVHTTLRLIDFSAFLRRLSRREKDRLHTTFFHLLPMPTLHVDTDEGQERSRPVGESLLNTEVNRVGSRDTNGHETITLFRAAPTSESSSKHVNHPPRGPEIVEKLLAYSSQLKRRRAVSIDTGTAYLQTIGSHELVYLETDNHDAAQDTITNSHQAVASSSRLGLRLQKVLLILLLPAMVAADQWVGLSWIVCFGAVLLLLFRGKHPDHILENVDAKLLLFFASLFVLVGGFSETGKVLMFFC
eukprot:gb/GECG01016311.1/.p1 GENE.gb/GECG01016311.1/~~gb/GECG01016311.1/.p1  ORF type:complete len:499 (+),score=40.66 gb/GECG01016311.1/:1-1497(+)